MFSRLDRPRVERVTGPKISIKTPLPRQIAFGRPRARVTGIKCLSSDFAPGELPLPGRDTRPRFTLFHTVSRLSFRVSKPSRSAPSQRIFYRRRRCAAGIARYFSAKMASFAVRPFAGPLRRAALMPYREPRDTRISQEIQSSQFTRPSIFLFPLSFLLFPFISTTRPGQT